MSNQLDHKLQRINELLAERAAFGLSDDDQRTLAGLLADSPVDPESFERTAALAALAFHAGPLEALPERLRDRIAAGAREEVGRRESGVGSVGRTTDNVPVVELSSVVRGGARYREIVAWVVAVACLLLAMFVLRRERASPLLTPVEERALLLERAPDVVKIPWAPAGDPAGKRATGDVVWSTENQAGYLRFKGLAENDPKNNQYQLWIFDATQDKRYPIDGGVFDFGPASVNKVTGDTVVPIRAKLRVASPQMFAVTVEKPGGVVVSSRNRLALIAERAAPGG